MIEWVVLDVGETLIDETRVWATWAKNRRRLAVDVRRGARRAVIARRPSTRAAFERLGVPDWRVPARRRRGAYGGLPRDDLYPDALRGTVDALRAQGRRVAILANQPANRHAELEAIGVRARTSWR